MLSDVYRVLYYSKIAATKSLAVLSRELEDILLVSRVENSACGITGVLVTDQKMFAQIVEGPADPIRRLIGRIAGDTRHYDFKIISSGFTAERIFQEWSMAIISSKPNQAINDQFFPDLDLQLDTYAVSVFCTSLRHHLLSP